MVRALLIITLLLFGNEAFCQNTFSIAGTVRDKVETLPGAGVYISGYKLATVTNNRGKFIIPNLQPGSYDILVQMIGYLPLSKKITITDKAVEVELKLTENSTLLKEVVIKPDPNRAYYLDLFKQFFIGKTPNAEQCKILNTNVLLIDGDTRHQILTVKATDFLVIENQALGYRIKYLLEQFEYNFDTKILFYAGYPSFEEMKGSQNKQNKWIKNREIAYKGSSQHFFRALYQNRINEEGFMINKRYQALNTNRLPDSIIKANIKQLIAGRKEINFSATDSVNNSSLNYWLKEERKPKTFAAIDRTNVLTDTLVNKFNNSLKMIKFKDELFVIYKNELEPPAYVKSSNHQNRPKDLENFQVSVVKMLRSSIYFYVNGTTADPNSTLYSGYWSYEKMADTVPIDYVSPLK